MNIYSKYSKRELQVELKRLTEMQGLYAKAGSVVMAHSYAGKIVTVSLELSKRP